MWSLGSSPPARLVASLLDALMDSFRSAYVRTGMNLAQSIVVVAVDLARRTWAAREN